jgi:hypothetical protein
MNSRSARALALAEVRPLLNIALATVRQITHELLRTLERELPAVVGVLASKARPVAAAVTAAASVNPS